MFFTDTHSPLYKWAGGLLHAFAHYTALFYVGWGSAFLVYQLYPTSPVMQLLVGAGLVFGLGWILGSVIVGLYLLVSLRIFGRHAEEAFSALRIQDHKNFLRLRIGEDGSLTLYPIGIERVPRRWRERRDDEAGLTPSRFVPEDGTPPRLIEPPIRLAEPSAALVRAARGWCRRPAGRQSSRGGSSIPCGAPHRGRVSEAAFPGITVPAAAA